MVVESLERRELLTADLEFATDQANLLADDLTLVAQQDSGNLFLKLLRTSGMSEVATAILDDPSDLSVNIHRDQTTAGEIDVFADTIRIDLNSLSLLNNFVVNNGGMLTLNFEGGIEIPGLSEDHLFLSSSGLASLAYGLSIITTADITANNVNATLAGDLLLRSSPQSSTSGTALDPDKVLSFPAAQITINGGSISANDVSLEAKSNKTLLVGADSVMDGQLSFAEVIVSGSANISIQNASVINATSNLTVWAESNITTDIGRVPTDDGNPGDDDSQQDAAIAISIIDSTSNLHLSGNSSLTAGGTANLISNNLVQAKSDADGTLGISDAGGITLAMTTVTGDTILLVDGGASVVSTGNLNVTANSIRSATTTVKATPGGAKDDHDNSTTTRGEAELSNADAGTSEGDVQFAAAIAIGNLSGNTSADIQNATLQSTGGNVVQLATAKHTIITTADSSTTSGDADSGIGVAVAIQHINADADARVLGTANISGNTVTVDARHDGSSLVLDSIAGPTGANSSDDLGVAGSLALGVTVANAHALIGENAVVDVGGANLTLSSLTKHTTTLHAIPHENAIGKSLGVGASVALNIVDHTTESAMRDGAVLVNVNNLSVLSQSQNSKTTEARAGASGGTAFAGAVSILVSNDDTFSRLGVAPSATNVNGSVAVTADSNSSTTTSAAGDAEGGEDAGIGAAFALAYDNQISDAHITRNLSISGALDVLSTSAGVSNVDSNASAKGGKKNESSNGQDSDARAAGARTDADARAADGGARSSSTTQSNPSSSNSDGSISVAAAFSVNLPESETQAQIADGLSVNVTGTTTVRALANHDAHTIANASSAEAGDTGVGIAVSLMSADVNNVASIGSSTLTTAGLILEAKMRDVDGDLQHSFDAQAEAGSGSADNSIAGSFTVNINTLTTQTSIGPAAVITAGNQDVSVKASANSTHVSHATPKELANGKSIGVGAAFVLEGVDETTTAVIENSVVVNGAHNLTVVADSNSTSDVLATAGAAGDTAFAGALAIEVGNQDTIAKIGTGSSTHVTGSLSISAEHHSNSNNKADGDAQGGADAGIGAAVSFAYLNESSDARTDRDWLVDGNVSVTSTSTGESHTEALASATGAQEKEGESTDSRSQTQRDSADSAMAESGARNSSSTQENPSASTNEGGSIAVAASVTINIAEAESHAVIPANRNLTVGGVTVVRSEADHDATAKADSSATLNGGDLAVGVAVGLVKSLVINEAFIGENTILTTKGLTVESKMAAANAEHTFSASATSGAGGGDNGIAGSVAIVIADTDTRAALETGVQINGLNGSAVIVRAESQTNSLAEAKPDESGGAGASSFGVGGSFSLLRGTHDVEATVANGASLASGATDVIVEALADHSSTAVAVNGAKNQASSGGGSGGGGGGGNSSSTGVGAAVSLALLHNNTQALLGTAVGTTVLSGNAIVRAHHQHHVQGNADGNADGGETGIGISFGLNEVDDHVQASIGRSLNVTGDLTVESITRLDSQLETKASASGTSSNSNNPDQEANAQRNPNAADNSGAATNTGDSSSVPSASSESSQGNSNASAQSGSESGGLGIAASVAFNIVELTNTATIGNNLSLQAGGNVRLSANGHYDLTAKGVGTSVTAEDSDTVAAGV
ncbi:MAG: hypothetical protein KDB03_22070, partial [Planctomycetales bacterium]|nr:hypothetical protein [Planctomycetales bacterium]